jgi:hypothetical protein
MEKTKSKKKGVKPNEILYNCKDNDVVLKFCFVDNEIDEILVQVDGEKGWTVIGYQDLLTGLKQAKKELTPKTSHDFGGGYIGEALLLNSQG